MLLGLPPMVIGMSFSFRELRIVVEGSNSQWWGSMAVAVTFGLALAAILTLVIVPTMYEFIDSASERLRANIGGIESLDPYLRAFNLYFFFGTTVSKEIVPILLNMSGNTHSSTVNILVQPVSSRITA